MIRLYTSDSCIWCKRMKNYLEKLNAQFEIFDVSDSKNAERAYELSGQNVVPVTVIGNRVIIGFDTDAVDDAIKNI